MKWKYTVSDRYFISKCNTLPTLIWQYNLRMPFFESKFYKSNHMFMFWFKVKLQDCVGPIQNNGFDKWYGKSTIDSCD